MGGATVGVAMNDTDNADFTAGQEELKNCILNCNGFLIET